MTRQRAVRAAHNVLYWQSTGKFIAWNSIRGVIIGSMGLEVWAKNLVMLQH